MSSERDGKKLWSEVFLSLTKEEKRLIERCPIVLVCSREDADLVGSLVWNYLMNNEFFGETFRSLASLVADIFNKRFACQDWSYLDFYWRKSFWDSKTKKSLFSDAVKRIEKKYATKVYIEPKKEKKS